MATETQKLFDYHKLKLRPWQVSAFNAWMEHNMRGVVEVPTGAGKTMLGIAAAVCNPELHSLVAVTTEQLMWQWQKFLAEQGITSGIVYAGRKDIQPVTVGIINSLREEDLDYFDILIADEIHHEASPENIKMLMRNNFYAVLGLTSTYERADGRHSLLESMFGLEVIYRMQHDEAISQNLLSKFKIVNVGIQLTKSEDERLKRQNYIVDKYIGMFGYDLNKARRAVMVSSEAADLMSAVQTRKSIIYGATNKISRATDIIEGESGARLKSIVFCEGIETADQVFHILKNRQIPCSIYHSKLKREERKQMLQDFKEGKTKCMISCKALDEGMNVPDASIAVVIAGSSVSRQMIQRLGRVLRASPEKPVAVLYQIYAKGTKDKEWLMKRSQGLFSHAESVEWV